MQIKDIRHEDTHSSGRVPPLYSHKITSCLGLWCRQIDKKEPGTGKVLGRKFHTANAFLMRHSIMRELRWLYCGFNIQILASTLVLAIIWLLVSAPCYGSLEDIPRDVQLFAKRFVAQMIKHTRLDFVYLSNLHSYYIESAWVVLAGGRHQKCPLLVLVMMMIRMYLRSCVC